jgi:hypothetical protein
VNDETAEALAFAIFLDARDRGQVSRRVFEEWQRLWYKIGRPVPTGAWECP